MKIEDKIDKYLSEDDENTLKMRFRSYVSDLKVLNKPNRKKGNTKSQIKTVMDNLRDTAEEMKKKGMKIPKNTFGVK